MSGPPDARILYVTYDGLLEPLGGSQVLPYVRALAEAGFEIDVLSFEKPRDLDRPGRVQGLRRELSGCGVSWIPERYHARPTLPATLRDVAVGGLRVRRWARRLARAGARGVVHARGYLPALMGLAGAGSGARLLFDMRGFWVDERIEAGMWKPGSLEVRIGRWVEQRVLRSADHLVLLTERAQGGVGALIGDSDAIPISVVPTCVDMKRFDVPHDASQAKRRLGLPPAPTLIHTGNLIGWYDGPQSVRIGKAFVERTGGSFVILTPQIEVARALARAEGVDARIQSVEHDEVPAWLHAADAGIALVRPSPAKAASLPTKVGEYLASGLAALVTDVGDLRAMADGEVLKVLASAEGPVEAAAWLAEAADRPGRAGRARALAARHLSLDRGVEVLAGVYRQLGVSPAGSRDAEPSR